VAGSAPCLYGSPITVVARGYSYPSFGAAALNQDGSLNSESNPAKAGTILTVFVNGAGYFVKPYQDGSIAGSSLVAPASPVSVWFGSQGAEVDFAGMAPGELAGMLQVNVRVPNPAPAEVIGSTQTTISTISVQVGNVLSGAATVFVGP
jgi:uncharacterized protein (TIGR03437 family)